MFETENKIKRMIETAEINYLRRVSGYALTDFVGVTRVRIALQIFNLADYKKERDHYDDQDVGGWTILKWILWR
jgi:hypothetical protein